MNHNRVFTGTSVAIGFFSFLLVIAMLFPSTLLSAEATFLFWGDRHSSNYSKKEVIDGVIQEIGGVAMLGGMLETLRQDNPNVLTVCTGNEFSGSPVSVMSHGKSDVDILGKLGTTILVPSVGELSYGWENLRDQVSGKKLDVLCANIAVDAERKTLFSPYRIYTFDDITIGVVGLSHPRVTDVVMRDGVVGLSPSDPIITALDFVVQYKGKCDLLVAVTNIGWKGDSLLAMGVPDLDLIIGGNSTTAFDSARMVNSIPIVRAGANGKKLGRITVQVDTELNRMTEYDAEMLTVEEGAATPDLSFDQLLSDAERKYLTALDEELGLNATDLVLDPKGPCNLAQWVTDALWVVERRANLILIRNRDLAAGIPKGKITKRTMLEAFPYDTPLLVVQIVGSEVKSIVSRQLSGRTSALTWHGLQLSPVKGRADVLEMTINGKAILDDEMYVMLTTGTLWENVESTLGLSPKIRSVFPLPNINVREHLSDVVKYQKVLDVKLDDRWKTE